MKKLLELGEESEQLRAAMPPDLSGRDFLDLSAQLRSVLVEWVTKQPSEPPALRLRSAQRLSVLNQEPK
ncbi:hypothetical protein [Kitasatospora sp. NPDC093558]|uniref:hypothetical protein n=1 Tax=Kitasatospora sp. NPDC093558 TaxID=3155201 RepID=UPI0034476785